MQADRTLRPAARRAIRRGPGDHLREAFIVLGRGKAQLLTHSEKPWASITFSGSRHRIAFAFHGAQAIEVGEALIDALPEHEFSIPGQLVADAQVVRVDHRLAPSPRLEVEAEILLLEDA